MHSFATGPGNPNPCIEHADNAGEMGTLSKFHPSHWRTAMDRRRRIAGEGSTIPPRASIIYAPSTDTSFVPYRRHLPRSIDDDDDDGSLVLQSTYEHSPKWKPKPYAAKIQLTSWSCPFFLLGLFVLLIAIR